MHTPLFKQFRVGQDLCCDSGTMEGRVGPEGANDPLQMRLNNHCLLRRAGEDKQAACSLACITQHRRNTRLGVEVGIAHTHITRKLIPLNKNTFQPSVNLWLTGTNFSKLVKVTKN